MMWTHQQGVLRSPEGEGGGGGGGPAGQPGAPQGDGNGLPSPQGDLISREEARKAFDARDTAKRERESALAERDAALADRDRIAAELEQLKRGAKPADPPTANPSVASATDEYRQRIEKIEREIENERVATRQRTLTEKVTNEVTPRSRGLVPHLLSGMLAEGKISMSSDADVEKAATDAISRLKADPNFALLFAPEPGSTRGAVQVGPGGKRDYSQVRTLADFGSVEELRDAPDEVITRIGRGQTGDARPAGMIAGSGRAKLFGPAKSE
jgi:hypothetical protein